MGSLTIQVYQEKYAQQICRMNFLITGGNFFCQRKIFSKCEWTEIKNIWIGLIDEVVVVSGAIEKMSEAKEEVVKDFAVIKRLAVKPGFQRRGYGTLMLAKLEEEARKNKYKIIMLDTDNSNLAARGLFLKNNYEKIEFIEKQSDNILFYKNL